MVVSVEQVQRGVRTFVEREIAQQATGFKKFAVYFIMPQLDKYTADYLSKFGSVLTTPDGLIDIDAVYNNAKEAIKHTGSFELMGIIFNETDLDKLYSYIKGG